MKVKAKLIFKFIPILVFYVESLPFYWKRFSGASFGFFVLIKHSSDKDEGLLSHELKHCEQFFRTLGISSLLYLFVPKFRLKYEIEAYMEQVKLYDPRKQRFIVDNFVEVLHNKYGLDKHFFKEEIRYDFYKAAGFK